MQAWLITWRSTTETAELRDVIAGFLPSSLSLQEVARITELLYANASYTLSERLALATGSHNPYPVSIDQVGDYIVCGHNPWLEARLAEIRVQSSEDSLQEAIMWTFPIPRGDESAQSYTTLN